MYYQLHPQSKSQIMKINQDGLRQWANFLAILAAFGTNLWANVAPLNGLTIGEISRTFFSDVLIIPANYAFAIWGLIYLGLISLAIYMVLPRSQTLPRLKQMGYYLVVSSISQIIWVFLFQFQLFALSVIAMAGILVPLIVLYLRWDINLTTLPSTQKWLINYPISIYLAWISIATIVNVASALDAADWSSWGINPQVWTAIMMAVGTIIAITVTWQRRDKIFGSVFVWALLAIAVRQWENTYLGIMAIVLAGILLIVILRKT
jgi:hypothetical protein